MISKIGTVFVFVNGSENARVYEDASVRIEGTVAHICGKRSKLFDRNNPQAEATSEEVEAFIDLRNASIERRP